ncbi:MAG: HAMP domain-containing histidine kinase, partial [Myxococcales bacterium]|nr:HAMP domain-containing histidine kinase [Myxococcales bacterium]
LLPMILLAGGVLCYFAWRTASQYAQLGEQTIAQATLQVARLKVDELEQRLIDYDNAVFEMVDFDEPRGTEERWATLAREQSPSVRAIVVLDGSLERYAFRVRGNDKEKWKFWRAFKEHIQPDLQLENLPPGRLKHLHNSYGGQNFLLSYKAFRHRGRSFYVVLHHDTGYIVREELPPLIPDNDKRFYNVVDEADGRRIYGSSLAHAGDFVVGRRFPTTLYRWRLQVAPEQAPLLEKQSKTKRRTEFGLIATAFVIILLGVLFILYAADQERRFNALKSEFIANVSHELKTPLSVIRMFSEMLLTGRVKDQRKAEQYFGIISRESERLSALIENVLDFDALERGKQKYELKEGNLTEVIARAVDTFRYRVEQEGTKIEFVPGDHPTIVHLDEQAILLAVINLLDNAVKYGKGSRVRILIEERDDRVDVVVADSGPGIPKEDLKKIFNRFYRARGHDGVRGSGIGLALVRHIAEAHGGKAWAKNSREGGAIVAFSLPLAMVPA